MGALYDPLQIGFSGLLAEGDEGAKVVLNDLTDQLFVKVLELEWLPRLEAGEGFGEGLHCPWNLFGHQ